MEKNYLSNMKFKPDYIVAYDENKGTYVGIPKSFDIYKSGYGKGGYSVIDGWVASKSHSNTPSKYRVIVWPSENQHYYDNDTCINIYKYLGDNINISSMEYKGKHDLFIYTSEQRAILAGKEMSLYDEIDNVKEIYEKRVNPFVNLVKSLATNTINDYKPKYDKAYNTLCNIIDEHLNNLADLYNKLYNKSVENSETVQKAKEYVREKTAKFPEYLEAVKSEYLEALKSNTQDMIDTLSKASKISKNDDYGEDKPCFLYRELTPEYAIALKHTKSEKYGSQYILKIFYMDEYVKNRQETYLITKVMFQQICNILNSSFLLGEAKYGFIRILIKDLEKISEEKLSKEETKKEVKTNAEKPKKDKPIQMCHFRPEDEIPSTTPKFVRKFKIGDKATPKKGKYAGLVGTVNQCNYNWNGKLKYDVVFNGPKVGCYYADQLNKI